MAYSTREVAELLDLSESRVRSFVTAGLLNPRRGRGGSHQFSFQDLVVLRAARDLSRTDVPPRKLHRALRELKERLPEGRPLAGVRVIALGGEVVVREKDAVWEPASGQIQFDFKVDELAGEVEVLTRRQAQAARSEAGLSADDWYNLGIDLEAVAPDQAPDAYRRAVELDPTHADALVNMGRLLQEAGTLREAESHYRQALAAEPDHALAAFNLGTVLEDLGRIAEAVAVYKQAAAQVADAHYNLARIYEAAGDRAAAIRHLSRFKSGD